MINCRNGISVAAMQTLIRLLCVGGRRFLEYICFYASAEKLVQDIELTKVGPCLAVWAGRVKCVYEFVSMAAIYMFWLCPRG